MIRAILLTLAILPAAVVLAQPAPREPKLEEAFACGESTFREMPHLRRMLSSHKANIESAAGEVRLERLNDLGVFLLDASAAPCAAHVYSVIESALPEESTEETSIIHAQYLLNGATAQRRLERPEEMYRIYVAAALRAPGFSEPCRTMAKDAANGLAPEVLLAALEELNAGDGFACGVTVLKAAFRSPAFREGELSAKTLAVWANYLAHARVTPDTFANWRDVISIPETCATCDVRVRSLNAAFEREATLPSQETLASMIEAWGDEAPKLAAVYTSVAHHLLANGDGAGAMPRAITAWTLHKSQETATLALIALGGLPPSETDPHLESISAWATMESPSAEFHTKLGVVYRRRGENETDVMRAIRHWDDAVTLAVTNSAPRSNLYYAFASRFSGDALRSLGCLNLAQARYIQGAEKFAAMGDPDSAETMLHKAESLGLATPDDLFRQSEKIRDRIATTWRSRDETVLVLFARDWLVTDPTLDVTSLEVDLQNGTLQVRGTTEKPPVPVLREGLYLTNVRRVRYLER